MPNSASSSSQVLNEESIEDATLEAPDGIAADLKESEASELSDTEQAESDQEEFDTAALAYDSDESLESDELDDAVPEEDDLDEDNDDVEDERTDKELAGEMLALIFASPDPLSSGRLGKLLGLKGKKKVQGGLDALALQLAEQGLPLVLRSVAGGWRLFTRPEMGELLSGLTERKPDRISPAALETLAIIAYRQPVSKAEIEAIRGVGSGPILRALVDRRLAKVTGRADQPGSPLLYGTTREFLERFGLDSPADLPRDGELTRD